MWKRKKSRVYETIVTTINKEKKPNAAPIGVYFLNNDKLVMKIYKENKTYENLIETKTCCVNIVYNPCLFIKYAILDEKDKEKILGGEITYYNNLPILKDAHAYLITELIKHREYNNKGIFVLKITKREILEEFPYPINRGLNAAVELAIDLSRGRKENIENHLAIMKKCLKIEEYKEIKKFLEEHL